MNQANTIEMNSRKNREVNVWYWLLLGLVGLKFFIHLWAAQRYGFHRDELLHLTQGNHLAFGYMEAPPVTAWMGRLARLIGGDHLFTIRTLTALAGLTIVWISLLMVRKLIPHPGRMRTFAQVLTVACILASPALFRNHTLFQPVVFDQLFWLLTYYFLLNYVLEPKPVHLLWMGAMAGVGMLAKYNMLFCGGGIVLAILFTPHRRLIFSKWGWATLGVTLLIVLPNLIWQYSHHFPVLDHFNGLYQKQLQDSNVGSFLWSQIKMHQYVTAPVWLAGLFYFLKNARLRWLGLAYCSTLGLFLTARGQAYYFNGIYPLMFVGGAVMITQSIQQVKLRVLLKAGLVIILLAFGMLAMPYGTPFLPIDSFINYSKPYITF